mmetsp:Transcript_107068/g.308035  ORF Transcript_107068/g.308035 Transcript_107068/m.308035 type:complete len:456 (+) Transcript_107068:56-1423(+)|eukprot:CAMPEP_0170237986 /NCGR_PEP_ID=MMETSP0116_2-20130129/18747_1 /TAXON_ID=400756 /ORGANISM="Durinskia baltica, Strain CSIRO CS-38" /LENGTH=455 /DNA_ID=CAMNT_0010488797 /DNA_START=56 /DNA_END=1423 /DNA_ORIENTATION=+
MTAMDVIDKAEEAADSALSHHFVTGESGQRVGLICCAVAAVGFGSNYVPVKHVDCGDGFLFSACMSVGIGIVGLLVNYSDLTSGSFLHGPVYQPVAMLGGAIWMVGNLMIPMVIRLVGLGIGQSMWDLSNMLMGWATGYFGLFGIWKESVRKPWLNLLGVGLACISLIVLAMAVEDPPGGDECVTPRRKTVASLKEDSTPDTVMEVEGNPFDCEDVEAAGSARTGATAASESSVEPPTEEEPTTEEEPPATAAAPPSVAPAGAGTANRGSKRAGTDLSTAASMLSMIAAPVRKLCGHFAGLLLALLVGVFCSATFNPSTRLVQDAIMGDSRFSENSVDYVLSNYLGIVATGGVSFGVYLAVRGRRAFLSRAIVLPGIASGILWGVAQAAWFKANQELSIMVAFPIVSAAPGIIALLWGVCLFGELRGPRLQGLAALAVTLRIPSVLCIALSDQVR